MGNYAFTIYAIIIITVTLLYLWLLRYYIEIKDGDVYIVLKNNKYKKILTKNTFINPFKEKMLIIPETSIRVNIKIDDLYTSDGKKLFFSCTIYSMLLYREETINILVSKFDGDYSKYISNITKDKYTIFIKNFFSNKSYNDIHSNTTTTLQNEISRKSKKVLEKNGINYNNIGAFVLIDKSKETQQKYRQI